MDDFKLYSLNDEMEVEKLNDHTCAYLSRNEDSLYFSSITRKKVDYDDGYELFISVSDVNVWNTRTNQFSTIYNSAGKTVMSTVYHKEFVYFVEIDGTISTLKRVSATGETVEDIVPMVTGDFVLVDDTIYLISGLERSLMAYDISGEQFEDTGNKRVMQIVYDGEMIYFTSVNHDNPNTNIKTYNLKTSETRVLKDNIEGFARINVDDKNIYLYENLLIKKIDKSSLESSILVDKQIKIDGILLVDGNVIISELLSGKTFVENDSVWNQIK